MASRTSTILQINAIPERSTSLPRRRTGSPYHGTDKPSAIQSGPTPPFDDENHPRRIHRWSLPAAGCGNDPPASLPTTYPYGFSQLGDRNKRMSSNSPPSVGLMPETLDREELIALVRTLHVDGLKARREVFRLQETLDSVTSQAARERERFGKAMEYQQKVLEASKRETEMLKAQLEEALDTLGTLLLREQ